MGPQEGKPRTVIRIPKTDKGVCRLHINVTNVDVSRLYTTVTLKKQEVAGFTIPHGTQLKIESACIHLPSGIVTVPGKQVNELLKMLYLDTLRTKK
jgi:hypothetical protein